SDSRFEAGFGRSPGSGNLFDVCCGLLARMERCVFVGPFREVYRDGAHATSAFIDCRFENCKTPWIDVAARFDAPPEGVRFERCSAADVEPAVLVGPRVALLADVAAASGGT